MKIRTIVYIMMALFCVLLTGCNIDKETGYKAGCFTSRYMESETTFGLKSDKDVFPINDVTMDLYYGLYDKAYEPYGSTYRHFEGEEIFFAIYACDQSEELSIINPMTFDDYKEIENHIYMKSISYEDAFTEEYGYHIDKKGIHYNHQETFTFPAELFTKDKGKVMIKICSFNPNTDGKTYETAVPPSTLELRYEMVDDETVRIIFD